MDLIVGANGFLGKNLSESIIDCLELTKKGVFFKGIKKYDNLDECIQNEKINNIFNCAVSYNHSNKAEINEVNFELPLKLFKISNDYNIKVICFGSFSEKETNEYIINYTESKLKLYSHIEELKSKNIFYLRLEHIYGKYDKLNKFIPSLIYKIKNKEKIILNDPYTIRDFTPIDHVIQLCHLIRKGEYNQNFSNIGTGIPQVTLQFIYKLISFYCFEKPDLFLEINNLIEIKDMKNKGIRESYAANPVFSRNHNSKYFKDLEENTFKDLFSYELRW